MPSIQNKWVEKERKTKSALTGTKQVKPVESDYKPTLARATRSKTLRGVRK